jgi:hypothetical protein
VSALHDEIRNLKWKFDSFYSCIAVSNKDDIDDPRNGLAARVQSFPSARIQVSDQYTHVWAWYIERSAIYTAGNTSKCVHALSI